MRSLATAAALLLLAPGLAALAPGADAQPTSEPLYEMLDADGDVRVGFLGDGAGIPPSQATGRIDIVALRILEESSDRLVLELEVDDLVGLPAAGSWFSNGRATIFFGLAGRDIEYRLGMNVFVDNMCCEVTEPQTLNVNVELCIYGPGTSCVGQWAFGSVDYERSAFVLVVTKAALLGQQPNGRNEQSTVPGLPRDLGPQHVLDRWRVEFQSNLFFDEAPDDGALGEPFRMSTYTANTKIRVRLAGQGEASSVPAFANDGQAAGTAERGLVPGIPAVIPVRIENRAGQDRLVNLSVVFNRETTKWHAQVVDSVFIPDGATRTVNLIVNATDAVDHREALGIMVQGVSVGHPEELGLVRLSMRASTPPDAAHPVLFVHATGQNEGTFSRQQELWLNTLEEDERGTLDDEGVSGGFSVALFGGQPVRLFIPLDAPLARDLVFDVSKPVTAAMLFSSQVAFDARVSLNVYAGDNFIGGGESIGTVAAGGSSFNFEFYIAPENERLVADGQSLLATVMLTPESQGGGISADSIKFQPRGSSLTLPLIKDPDPPQYTLSLGPAQLGLHFVPDDPNSTRPEAFVNPNRTALFRVQILNEGVEADTAELNLTFKEQPGWEVAVQPALKYELGPGEAATFGVLVSAGANATEGEQLRVAIEATSVRDNKTRTRLTITATATDGIDIPDQASAFLADNDTLASAIGNEGGRSPATGPLAGLGLVAVAAMAVARRRRQTL